MSVMTVYLVLYYDIIVANTLINIFKVLYYDITIEEFPLCPLARFWTKWQKYCMDSLSTHMDIITSSPSRLSK